MVTQTEASRSAATQRLVDVLDVMPQGEDRFRATSWRHVRGRAFGGQVVAQALAAAARTVDGARHPHTLRAAFLRAGNNTSPLELHVERVRDGRAYSGRSVAVAQDDRQIATVDVSFHAGEPGFAHGDQAPPGPRPEELSDDPLGYTAAGAALDAFDLRYVDGGAIDGHGARRTWFRSARLGAEQTLHRCLATYISDLWLLDVILQPHGHRYDDRRLQFGSLDLVVWFHRDVRVDRWTQLVARSPVAADGRGLVHGQLFSDRGKLVATVMQEAMVRVRDEDLPARSRR